MKYKTVKELTDGKFRRITGVKRKTFLRMVELVRESKEKSAKGPGGRPSKLSTEDKVLMMLEYLREYRTYAHIAASYGISETRAFENIRMVEDILIKSEDFRLPGKKALLKNDVEYEVILIDATESPIERPKKNNVGSIQAKRKNTLSKLKLL